MNQQQNTGYYLPRETAMLLTANRLNTCKNLGLILDKYPPQTAIQDSAKKGDWLKVLASRSYIDAELMRSVYTRWLNITDAAGAQHFSAATDWRMVVGLGGETVLETDLTLHHLYGIPYIPASALKGLTRNYVATEVYSSPDIDHDDPVVKGIFGTQDKAGTVIFFDAMPINGEAGFVLDIMNAHYPNYYGEKKAPTNDQNPNPVTFLTVTNTTFMFAVAARNPKYQSDVEKVVGWLKDALQKYGVGGKTSAGYGYFKDVHDRQEQATQTYEPKSQTASSPINTASASSVAPANPEMQQAESLKGAIEAMKDSDVANQINAYYQRWKQLTSQEARTLLAKAIIEKVHKAKREKVSADRPWYKELRAFLGEA